MKVILNVLFIVGSFLFQIAKGYKIQGKAIFLLINCPQAKLLSGNKARGIQDKSLTLWYITP
ncbi:MAG: hypothetical protein OEZ36_10420 [Spirochaetota bacterium]|nr:hypothetical protein [Spirochaetota bacterium]